MKLGSIIMTLRTKGSPWDTAIRNHLSWKKIQNTGLSWKGHVDCFLEFGTCCSCRLSWKRNNNKLSLHCNSYCIKKKNQRDWNKKWNTSSTQQPQASHRCSNKRCNSTPGFSVLPHPLYSQNLAPSDFHLFPKLKEHLKVQCFSCDEEVKSAVRKWFQKQNTNFFKDGFQKLVQHWRRCIEVSGDFVEK